MSKIKVFVDQLTDDKTIGFTKNPRLMIENTSKFFIKNVKHTEDMQGLIFIAGRFICCVIDDTDGQLGMIFFDVKKDRTRAGKIATEFFTDEPGKLFLKNFEQQLSTYRRDYDLVEMVLKR